MRLSKALEIKIVLEIKGTTVEPRLLHGFKDEDEYPGKAGLFWVLDEHIGGRVLSQLQAPGANPIFSTS